MILKKVTFQLLYISFNEDIWSTIEHYKNTFDSFNLYISFTVKNNLKQIQNKVLSNNKFAFHIEDGSYDTLLKINPLIHIYSLPFNFKELYGFTCYSKLNQQCSFSSVRHLYFTENCHNRILSFQSLEKRMPSLVSVDCSLCHSHYYGSNSSKNSYNDVLYNIRTLHFKATCFSCSCVYCNEFVPTVGRMPNLKVLTASCQTFNEINHPLTFLKNLHLHNCQYINFDKFATIVPNLSILLLTDLPSDSRQLSLWIRSFFVRFSQLMVLSIQVPHDRGNNERPDKNVAEQILTKVQNMDSKFQHLKLTFENIRMEFSFLNF
jgi:hypothetical protein